ncbi:T9SS type A sorting domain-containing protein [Candidatus Cloacimonadota bacterium]
MSKRNVVFMIFFIVITSMLMSLEVGEMYSIDMGNANPAGVTSDGSKVAAYFYPWGGVISWTEEGGVVTVDTEAEASAIDDNGNIYGSKLDAGLGYELPCYWDADNVYHELPYLDIGQHSDNFFCSPWASTADGSRLSGMQWISAGGTTPVMWYKDEMDEWQILDLNPDDSDHSGRANAINSDGSEIAGWVEADDGSWIPTIWTVDEELNVTMESLPAPPDWVNGNATAFSSNDEYLAGYMNSMGALWFQDGTFDMFEHPNPSGWSNTTVTNVSDDALCVGRTIDYWNWDQWAFVYRPGMGYMRADDYLNMFGVTYPNDYQFLDMIFWISGDESMMFGWYYDTAWGIKMFMLLLPELSYIEGTVTLNGTIGSVDEVLIEVGQTGTYPDSTGSYSLAIGAGTYDMTFSRPGYITEIIEDVVVEEGETLSGMDVTLNQIENAGFLQGDLSAIYSWDPFTTAEITAYNDSATYSTFGTAVGDYQLILPAGTYDILATQLNCYDVLIEDVVVVANEVTELDIEFMSIYTPAYYHLDVVVDDPENFDWSTIKGKIGNNDTNNQFSFWESTYDGQISTPGVYTISAWAEGYEVWIDENIEFAQNDTVNLTVVLEKNSYPVRDLVVNNNGTASWDIPMRAEATYQDFENFQTDLFVTSNINYWSTPNYSGPNPVTTEEMSYEGMKSLEIGTVDGIPTDIYREYYPEPETGTYVFESMLYIPTGYCAHQGIIKSGGTWDPSFAIEIFYRADGTLEVLYAGTELSLTYPHDEWFSVKLVGDLDNDIIEYYQNGELIVSSQYSLDAWTGDPGDALLDIYDISAEARPGNTEDGLVYMDNYAAYMITGNSEATYSVSLDSINQISGLENLVYQIEGLTTGETYTAGVIADYDWASSNEVTVDFIYDPESIEVPENLAANSVGNDVFLNWDAPGTNRAEIERYKYERDVTPEDLRTRDLTGYRLYRDGVAITDLTAGVTEFVDLNVEYTTYEYYVTALYATTTESDPSNIVTITVTPMDLNEPTDLMVSNTGMATWSAPEAGSGGEIFFDDFEDGADNWTIINNEGSVGTWMLYDEYPNSYQMPETSSGFVMAADADEEYPIDSELVNANAFDCSGLSTVYLEFDSDFNALDTDDLCYVYVSNDGSTWNTVLEYLGVDVRETHEMIDISEYAAGESEVWVKFHSIQPGWDWYWVLDNISINDGIRSMSTPLISAKNDVPGSRDLMGYNVYLDGELVAENIPEEYHQYYDLAVGEIYTAGVAAYYDEGESDVITYEFVYDPFPVTIPPNGLEIDQTGYAIWNEPEAYTTEELIYDNGVASGTYSTSGDTYATFMDPGEICQVLELKYYTGYGTEFNAEVWGWENEEPTQDMLLQELVTTVATDDWTVVDITDLNLIVDGYFLVGYGGLNWDTTLGVEYAGNGRTWQRYSWDGSWNYDSWNTYLIRAVVLYADGRIATLTPTLSQPINENLRSKKSGSHNSVDFKRDMITENSRDFLGYNVYLDGIMVAENVAIESYLFTDLTDGVTYTGGVTANYDEGESVMITADFTYESTHLAPENVSVDPYTWLCTWSPPGGSIIFEDFDGYNVGEYLAVQSDHWTTWSNDPGSGEDALISDEQALSGTNSVKIDANESVTDLVLIMEDYVTGAYEVELNMYIPTDGHGYYNLQKSTTPGEEWAFQAEFPADGTAIIDAGGFGAANFEFAFDEWLNFLVIVDIDADWAEFYYNGTLIIEYQWSLGTQGVEGLHSLGGMNIYAQGADALFYIDDVDVRPHAPTRDLTGYNVYLDAALMASDLTVYQYQFSDLVAEQEYTAGVVAVYDDGESQMTEFTFTALSSPITPPSNLMGEIQDYNDVMLTWDAPSSGGGETEELIYDNDVTTGAYSYVGYSMCTQMTPAEACQILELKIHTSAGSEFNAEVWGWDTAPTEDLLYQELITTVATDDWNIIDISAENLMVTGDFLVGFGSIAADTYMSYDGALNNGRSWDHADAGGWSTWSEAYLLRAVVQYGDGRIVELSPGTTKPVSPVNVRNTSIARNKVSIDVIDHIVSTSSRILTGYSVYKDGEEIASVDEGTLEYLDAGLNAGDYEYHVTAVYDNGESDPSNTIDISIVLPAPANFNAVSQGDNTNIMCTWSAPAETRALSGYKVYRDDVEIGTATGTFYMDMGVSTGTYVYHATAMYDDMYESEASNQVEVDHVGASDDLIPLVTELSGNFPNPFNPVTNIKFALSQNDHVRIDIYNIKGEKVTTLVDEEMEAAFYTLTWNGTDENQKKVTSGVYFYKMKAGRYTSTKKMIMLK